MDTFQNRQPSDRPGSPRGRRRSVLLTAAILSSVMLVGTGTSFGVVAPSNAAQPEGGNFDVRDYQVTMSYQPATKALQGATVISATASEALDSFTLAVNGPTVRSVTVNSEAVKSFSTTGGSDLVIVPTKTIARGAGFRVRIQYDGTPGTGWYPTTSGGASGMEGLPSAWFPAHSGANDRADFQLTATVPSGWSVVSVGRQGPVRHGSGTTTFHWSEPNADPHSLAVSIDRFTLERSKLADGTPVLDAYAPGLESATKSLADQLPEILDFLSGMFGPYPFDAAGGVFVDVNSDAPGTAPQTRPVYLGAANAKYMNIDEVVHEETHQWYGVSADAGTPADACLAECLAVYGTWLWDAAKDGVDLDARYRQQVNANIDNAGFWEPLYVPGQATGINMYTKGPLALHALRREIGDTAFFRLLRLWPQVNRGMYVDVPQFEAFAEKVAGKDLSGFFQAWFLGSKVPPTEYLWPGTHTVDYDKTATQRGRCPDTGAALSVA